MFMELGALGAYASITGISVATLKANVATYLKHLKEKQNEELVAKRSALYSQAIADRKHLEALHSLYPLEELGSAGLCRASVCIDDKTVPTTLAAKKEWLALPESINLRDTQKYSFLENAERPRQLSIDTLTKSQAEIELFKFKVFDNNMYRLHDIDITNSHIGATFSLDTYFNYRYGLGSLWGELLQGLVDTENNVEELIAKKAELLPRRIELLADASQIADYGKRLCIGGIHATVAMFRKESDDFVIPIQTRSGTVGGGQNMIGVLPQGYHQPLAFPQEEMSFAQTFYREFFEELLGGEEASEKTRHLKPDWYMKSSEVMQWFSLPTSKYTLWITGVGLNLVSGNYEIALLCIIEDPDFWPQHSHKLITCWEHSEDTLPFLSTRDCHAVSRTLLKPNWIGEGLYSLVRGLIHLNKSRPANVDLPDLTLVLEQAQP
ncbi:hypothetical protein MUO79_03595 [Candidatus Bathyarchaeota archaeon]|nr:hypothetical protein [Candidatus Bathyarchaeota archaeon]